MSENKVLLNHVIRGASNAAWKLEMDCECDAEIRSECICRRTESFKKTARLIRREILGDEWDKPIESEVKTEQNEGENAE